MCAGIKSSPNRAGLRRHGQANSAAGWDATQRHIWEEECALAGTPPILPFGVNMVAPVIMAFGSPEQKAYYSRASSIAPTGGARAIPSPAPAPTWLR